MFIPTTMDELKRLGWERLDVILVCGDTYLDSPYFGFSMIGKVLLNAGYRVGIISQPDTESGIDITRLGEPCLFWGVTSGCVDSMVSNYTATKKRRRRDDLTPGGINNRRPDRALVVYTNLIRRHFKDTVPIVLGGIEASLRRIAHYDYWSNSIRRSILFDAKADILVYGMGERAVIEIAEKIKGGNELRDTKGICYRGREKMPGYVDLPSYEDSALSKEIFSKMFKTFYNNNNPITAKGLQQRHGDRYLIHNPPQPPLSTRELDQVYNLGYERDVHPYYKDMGKVKALDTIRFSITTHRGCYGECNFCAITVHQGRGMVPRSEESILKEAQEIIKHPLFKGIIYDLGGPTANMYTLACKKMISGDVCRTRRCIYPSLCKNLRVDHGRQINLLKRLRKIPKIKRVFVASGIRYDLVLADTKNGERYLRELLMHHISGQMKIAPEHISEHILRLMGKPPKGCLLEFKGLFKKINRELGKRQFLTYYFIAAHPGCTLDDMKRLKGFAANQLHLYPEQVQIFTPTPSTYSALMYWTEKDPFSGRKIFVEKDTGQKEIQKRVMKSEAVPIPSQQRKYRGMRRFQRY